MNSKIILGDGNCLFRCFSFFLYGNEDHHMKVRNDIVSHICKNWDEYRYSIIGNDSYNIPICLEIDKQLTFSKTRNFYYNYMSQNRKYGADAECKAFSDLYPVVDFKIQRNSNTLINFGTTDNGNKLILDLSGPLDEGHYNILDFAKTSPVKANEKIVNVSKNTANDSHSFDEVSSNVMNVSEDTTNNVDFLNKNNSINIS